MQSDPLPQRRLSAVAQNVFALVALLLRARGFDAVDDFGVAPATLAHWARERRGNAA